ncbi:MAG: hypothetical protein M1609_07610 [Firmicutes bacterium]|nr:hypothetical protein [Bacillota bacterium]
MKRILWVLVLAALTLANAYMTREQAAALSQAAQLRTEKEQLAGEIAGLEAELSELQSSHELYISVSDDLNSRLAVVEGRAGP